MIELHAEIKGAHAQLAMAASRLQDLTPFYAVAATKVKADIARNFREGGWYPRKWGQTRRGGQVLVDKGLLRRSMQTSYGPDFARAGSDVKYAAVHQLGKRIEAKNPLEIRPKNKKCLSFVVNGRTVRAKKVVQRLLRWKVGDKWVAKAEVTIPARPFLPVDGAGNLHPDTVKFLEKQLAKYASGGTPSGATA